MRKLTTSEPVPNVQSSLKKHSWEDDWLNHSNGEKTCKTCGVTMLGENRFIQADRLSNSRQYRYRDIAGHFITSFTELSCPVYMENEASGAAVALETARTVKSENQISSQRLSQLEDRIIQLETANLDLQNQISQGQNIQITMLAKIFVQIVQSDQGMQIIQGNEALKQLLSAMGTHLPSLEGKEILSLKKSEDQ